jgi:hypothetical protein
VYFGYILAERFSTLPNPREDLTVTRTFVSFKRASSHPINYVRFVTLSLPCEKNRNVRIEERKATERRDAGTGSVQVRA